MATLTIRNLPDGVHAALRERARRNHRSVNQQVIAELSSGRAGTDEERTERARTRVRDATAEIDVIRSRMKRFLTAEEIDAAVEEGRA